LSPIIKWTGSKRPIADKIHNLWPKTEVSNYIEPFVGGGSCLYDCKAEKIIASDVMPELIGFWNFVKSNPDKIISHYSSLWESYQKDRSIFLSTRERFNQCRDPLDLLFLSRTSINGLIRFNKSGNFNASLHHNRSGINPKKLKNIVADWSARVQKCEFLCSSYQDTVQFVDSKSQVFLDPPYIGSDGKMYSQGLNVEDFYKYLDTLNKIGCNWIVTFGEHDIPKELFLTKIELLQPSPFRKLQGNSRQAKETIFTNFRSQP